MIKFYGTVTPSARRIFIALEEMQLPYEFVQVNVFKGEQFKPAFVELNPNSKVPVIVDPEGLDGRPVTIFESAAILLYLAEKTGKLLPQDPARKYEAIEWTILQVASVGPNFGHWVHFSRFAPEGSEYAKARFTAEVRRLFGVLEMRLGQSRYVGGAEFTIADIAAWPWVQRHQEMGIDLIGHANFDRWNREMAERPAFKIAVAKVAQLKSGQDAASTEDFDRLFGRGKFAGMTVRT